LHPLIENIGDFDLCKIGCWLLRISSRSESLDCGVFNGLVLEIDLSLSGGEYSTFHISVSAYAIKIENG